MITNPLTNVWENKLPSAVALGIMTISVFLGKSVEQLLLNNSKVSNHNSRLSFHANHAKEKMLALSTLAQMGVTGLVYFGARAVIHRAKEDFFSPLNEKSRTILLITGLIAGAFLNQHYAKYIPHGGL